MSRLFRILIHATWMLTLTLASLVVWALWIEKPFLSYENLPFPAQLSQVRPGEVIPLVVKRCSSAESMRAYAVTHELRSVGGVNPSPLILPAEVVTIAPGCREGVSLINRVPVGTPPGRYMVTGLGIVQGTMRTFAVPWHSQPFEVTQ